MIHILGIIGAIVIIVASTFTSIRYYRSLNAIGAFIFLIYGVCIKNWPVIVLMVALIYINLHKMLKPQNQERYYYGVDMHKDDEILIELLKFYEDDIKKFFPQFKMSDEMNFFEIVMHDGKPVGFFIGIRDGEKCTICLDYAIPKFRNSSVGQFLYKHLASIGIKTLVLEDKSIHHEEFLRNMGFVKKGSSYVKTLYK